MPNQQQFGSFLPTTFVWDVSQIYETDVNSVQFKELLVRLHEFVNLIAVIVNTKDTGYYVLDEFVNGQLFFPNPSAQTSQSQQTRQVYRKLINFGTLPNSTTKAVAHNITTTPTTTFTRIYAAASDPVGRNYIPIPYATPVADDIALDVDSTDVIITTGADRTNFTICYVILEYLQQ